MKRNNEKRYDKLAIVEIALNIIGALLLLWCVISFIDVIAHNSTDYEYWRFNLFNLLFNNH